MALSRFRDMFSIYCPLRMIHPGVDITISFMNFHRKSFVPFGLAPRQVAPERLIEAACTSWSIRRALALSIVNMLGERRKGYQRRIVLQRARGHRVLYGRSLRCCVEPPHPTSWVPDLYDLTVWVTPRVRVSIDRAFSRLQPCPCAGPPWPARSPSGVRRVPRERR